MKKIKQAISREIRKDAEESIREFIKKHLRERRKKEKRLKDDEYWNRRLEASFFLARLKYQGYKIVDTAKKIGVQPDKLIALRSDFCYQYKPDDTKISIETINKVLAFRDSGDIKSIPKSKKKTIFYRDRIFASEVLRRLMRRIPLDKIMEETHSTSMDLKYVLDITPSKFWGKGFVSSPGRIARIIELGYRYGVVKDIVLQKHKGLIWREIKGAEKPNYGTIY